MRQGDLYLLGFNLIGYFKGYKAGHSLNNKLIRKLLTHKDAWEFITYGERKTSACLPFGDGCLWKKANGHCDGKRPYSGFLSRGMMKHFPLIFQAPFDCVG